MGWTVCCGVAAVAFCVLWVRSSSWVDMYVGQVAEDVYVGGCSTPGACAIGFTTTSNAPPWTTFSQNADEWWSFLSEGGSPPYSSRVWGGFRCDDGCLMLPYWFVILVGATLAIVPWIRMPRWQFSLRMLLIATTLIAVALGLVVYLTKAPTTPPVDVGDFGAPSLTR
jgi:hypothetical protein